MDRRVDRRIWRLGLGGLLLSVGLSGCQLGPGRLQISSAHYSDAVRVAASEQLLVNLVRLRYRDLPVFLGVSSISTQFEFDASLEAGGDVGFPGPDSTGIGGGIRYSERPTISFSIRGGEEFQRRMLRPVPVAAVGLLAESGWRADRVMRLLVEEMNGLKNAPTASGPTPTRAPEYRDFLEAVSLLQRLIGEDLIRLELEDRSETLSDPLPVERVEGLALVEAARSGAALRKAKDGGYEVVGSARGLLLRFSPRAEASTEARRLRELLRLAPGQQRFEVVAAEGGEFDPFAPKEHMRKVSVDTRSLMGALFYVSNGVEPPPEDLESGLATATVDAAGAPFAWSQVLGDLFRAASSADEPADAAVAVRHRGRWFHVADDDESSKSTFMLLDQLFTLSAGDVEETRPVLTLPVGG